MPEITLEVHFTVQDPEGFRQLHPKLAAFCDEQALLADHADYVSQDGRRAMTVQSFADARALAGFLHALAGSGLHEESAAVVTLERQVVIGDPGDARTILEQFGPLDVMTPTR